jgi:hypothetical protein
MRTQTVVPMPEQVKFSRPNQSMSIVKCEG